MQEKNNYYIGDLYESFVQLIFTIGKEKTYENNLPPLFLGAFDSEKIAFIQYRTIESVLTQNDFNWKVAPSNHNTIEFKQLYQRLKSLLLSKIKSALGKNFFPIIIDKKKKGVYN